MNRRAFVRLLAATPLVRTFPIQSEIPAFRVVSSYAPVAMPGMPGPYRGRVVSVTSDKCIGPSTGRANDEAVREMIAQGMRTVTGAISEPEAWRQFFEP